MRSRFPYPLIAAIVGLAGCVDPPPLPSGPPEIGRIEARFAGEPTTWLVRDFSLGAIDPSAFAYEGELVVIGYLPGTEVEGADFGAGSLEIRVTLPPTPTGEASAEILRIVDAPAALAPRWTSRDGSAEVVIERLTPPATEDQLYGRVSGRFSARLCRASAESARPSPTECRELTGRFDTDLRLE